MASVLFLLAHWEDEREWDVIDVDVFVVGFVFFLSILSSKLIAVSLVLFEGDVE